MEHLRGNLTCTDPPQEAIGPLLLKANKEQGTKECQVPLMEFSRSEHSFGKGVFIAINTQKSRLARAINLGLLATRPLFRVSDNARLKQVSPATETR